MAIKGTGTEARSGGETPYTNIGGWGGVGSLENLMFQLRGWLGGIFSREISASMTDLTMGAATVPP